MSLKFWLYNWEKTMNQESKQERSTDRSMEWEFQRSFWTIRFLAGTFSEDRMNNYDSDPSWEKMKFLQDVLQDLARECIILAESYKIL